MRVKEAEVKQDGREEEGEDNKKETRKEAGEVRKGREYRGGGEEI